MSGPVDSRRVDVQSDPLVMNILSCESIDEKDKNGLQEYEIVAAFNEDETKCARFSVWAKSMKIAFEVIEGIGRHTDSLNEDQFDEFITKHVEKQTTFRIGISHDEKEGEDTVSFHRRGRISTAFKTIFPSQPIKLDKQALKDINELARHWNAKFKKKKPKPTRFELSRVDT